ncbi:hypothetical protein KY336_00350 [Candidatus Woesearchaeota archaeon]|nr:hypothetical protein [Candidatus Woesearchaeota archaeon]
MEFRKDNGGTITIEDRMLITAIDNAYSSWYFYHDREIEDPDKIIRLGMNPDLTWMYEKSKDMQEKLQYVMDYTVNKSHEFVGKVCGREKGIDLTNTDGTLLTEEQFNLIWRLSSWTRHDLFP